MQRILNITQFEHGEVAFSRPTDDDGSCSTSFVLCFAVIWDHTVFFMNII